MDEQAREPRTSAPDDVDEESASDQAGSDDADPTEEESSPEQPVVQHSGTPLVEPATDAPAADPSGL